MKLRLLPCLACLFVAAAAVGTAEAPVRIEWKPKEGNELKFKLTMNASGDMGGGEMAIEAEIALTYKVLKVNDDGTVKVEESESMVSLFVDDQDMTDMVAGQGGSTTTIVYKPNGEPISREVSSAMGVDNPRMAEGQVFIFPDEPVSPGDTWTRTTKGESDKGTVDTKTSFKYIGTEMVGSWSTYKILYDFTETVGNDPYTAKGHIWLSVEDGEMVKGELRLENFEPGPGAPIMDAGILISRVD